MSRHQTLVLNADYQPVSIYPLRPWSMHKAILKTSGTDVAVVVENHDVEIRSARSVIRPPSIVALRKFQPRSERVAFTRMNVLTRDNFSCQYCGCRLTLADLTFDHVVPRSKKGPTSFLNIVSACFECNKRKADKSSMRPIREPFEPTQREMARLRPVRSADIPASWRPWLESAGIPVINDCVTRPAEMSRTARDGIYWNGVLET